MTTIEYEAHEYCADRSFRRARYRLRGDEQRGFTVERDGVPLLELGPGYRALRVQQCGVCSTDLARHLLPFELPQVIGHEVLARDERGRRFVVEINASHHARGVAAEAAACPYCAGGLASHCPARVTLGIDRLPGGFGPWILAPVAACFEVPAGVDDDSAVLVEPFAAALHAVQTVAPCGGERIAVLGPRRLGMLVVGALRAVRGARRDGAFSVHAVVRDRDLRQLALTMGADEVHVVGDGASLDGSFDVVIDTTGNPAALDDAVRMAKREVHLKSTHGQRSCGLDHLTELVVDELSIGPFDAASIADGARVAWLARDDVGFAGLSVRCAVARGDAEQLAQQLCCDGDGMPGADVCVVDDAASVDAAIRPGRAGGRSLLRPRGRVLITGQPAAGAGGGSALLDAVVARGLMLSSSRCGDFAAALQLLERNPALRTLGARFVTHRFEAADLPNAFGVAASRACVKAVVRHGG